MNAEKREAVKILLQRYDVLSAWKLAFIPFFDLFVVPFFYAVTIIYLFISILVFSTNSAFSQIFKKEYYNFSLSLLQWFSNHSIITVFSIFSLFCIYRIIKVAKDRLSDKHRTSLRYKPSRTDNKNEVKTPVKFLKEHRGTIFLFLLFFTLASFLIDTYYLVFFALILLSFFISIRKDYFVVSVFLPRIIISVTYIWATFVLTEENTRLFYGLSNNAYFIIFIISILGTLGFLYFEANQNSPSTPWKELVVKRVFPVFSYTVTIAVIFAFIINVLLMETRNSQAEVLQVNFFKESVNSLNEGTRKYEELNKRLDNIRHTYYNLPYIPYETKLQSLTTSDIYSARYSWAILDLQKKFDNLFDLMEKDSFLIKNEIDYYFSSVVKPVQLDTIGIALNDINDLRKQDFVYSVNDKKIKIIINSFDELSFSLKRRLDMMSEKYIDDAPNIFNHVSGYDYFNNEDINNMFPDELYQLRSNEELFSKRLKVLYTSYPLRFNQEKSKKDTFTINLKSFLIQIAISIALGVVGQLIVSEKTVTEAL